MTQQGQPYEFSRQSITPLWNGEALLLWRPYPTTGELLGIGAQGSGVSWLRNQLDELGYPAKSKTLQPHIFDRSLMSQIRRFQDDRGLVADGIAGTHTLIALNTAIASPNTPTLSIDLIPAPNTPTNVAVIGDQQSEI
ncbi:MAG: peptidoglycan-binding protein [Gammaproteobacteria bacterium]|nr:peptidoglycan-binding protein [Gammaproteobacteria bacterium]